MLLCNAISPLVDGRRSRLGGARIYWYAFRLADGTVRPVPVKETKAKGRRRGSEPLMPKPDCRSIADAMASNAASYVFMAPPVHRDEATASVAEGFRDAV